MSDIEYLSYGENDLATYETTDATHEELMDAHEDPVVVERGGLEHLASRVVELEDEMLERFRNDEHEDEDEKTEAELFLEHNNMSTDDEVIIDTSDEEELSGIDADIAELESKYDTYKRADKTSKKSGVWSEPLAEVRSKLIALLEEKSQSLTDELRENQLPDDRAELRNRKHEVDSTIEELRA